MFSLGTVSTSLKKYAVHFFNSDCIGSEVDKVLRGIRFRMGFLGVLAF